MEPTSTNTADTSASKAEQTGDYIIVKFFATKGFVLFFVFVTPEGLPQWWLTRVTPEEHLLTILGRAE